MDEYGKPGDDTPATAPSSPSADGAANDAGSSTAFELHLPKSDSVSPLAVHESVSGAAFAEMIKNADLPLNEDDDAPKKPSSSRRNRLPPSRHQKERRKEQSIPEECEEEDKAVVKESGDINKESKWKSLRNANEFIKNESKSRDRRRDESSSSKQVSKWKSLQNVNHFISESKRKSSSKSRDRRQAESKRDLSRGDNKREEGSSSEKETKWASLKNVNQIISESKRSHDDDKKAVSKWETLKNASNLMTENKKNSSDRGDRGEDSKSSREVSKSSREVSKWGALKSANNFIMETKRTSSDRRSRGEGRRSSRDASKSSREVGKSSRDVSKSSRDISKSSREASKWGALKSANGFLMETKRKSSSRRRIDRGDESGTSNKSSKWAALQATTKDKSFATNQPKSPRPYSERNLLSGMDKQPNSSGKRQRPKSERVLDLSEDQPPERLRRNHSSDGQELLPAILDSPPESPTASPDQELKRSRDDGRRRDKRQERARRDPSRRQNSFIDEDSDLLRSPRNPRKQSSSDHHLQSPRRSGHRSKSPRRSGGRSHSKERRSSNREESWSQDQIDKQENIIINTEESMLLPEEAEDGKILHLDQHEPAESKKSISRGLLERPSSIRNFASLAITYAKAGKAEKKGLLNSDERGESEDDGFLFKTKDPDEEQVQTSNKNEQEIENLFDPKYQRADSFKQEQSEVNVSPGDEVKRFAEIELHGTENGKLRESPKVGGRLSFSNFASKAIQFAKITTSKPASKTKLKEVPLSPKRKDIDLAIEAQRSPSLAPEAPSYLQNRDIGNSPKNGNKRPTLQNANSSDLREIKDGTSAMEKVFRWTSLRRISDHSNPIGSFSGGASPQITKPSSLTSMENDGKPESLSEWATSQMTNSPSLNSNEGKDVSQDKASRLEALRKVNNEKMSKLTALIHTSDLKSKQKGASPSEKTSKWAALTRTNPSDLKSEEGATVNSTKTSIWAALARRNPSDHTKNEDESTSSSPEKKTKWVTPRKADTSDHSKRDEESTSSSPEKTSKWAALRKTNSSDHKNEKESTGGSQEKTSKWAALKKANLKSGEDDDSRKNSASKWDTLKVANQFLTQTKKRSSRSRSRREKKGEHNRDRDGESGSSKKISKWATLTQANQSIKKTSESSSRSSRRSRRTKTTEISEDMMKVEVDKFGSKRLVIELGDVADFQSILANRK